MCLRGRLPDLKNYATGRIGTPLDFISFHAKGAPSFVEGHVRLGISAQLLTIDDSFALMNSIPELRQRPVVIGESDPAGCAACQGDQVGYRNGALYASYTAARLAREWEIAERRQVRLEGSLTWAFEFENQPYFAGFRVLASNGLTLPVSPPGSAWAAQPNRTPNNIPNWKLPPLFALSPKCEGLIRKRVTLPWTLLSPDRQ